MGDILNSIFGGGSRTTQDTKVDPTTRAMNELKYGQAADFFGDVPLWSLGAEGQSAYQPSAGVEQLYSQWANSGAAPFMSFADYSNMAGDRSLLNAGVGASREQYSDVKNLLGDMYGTADINRSTDVAEALASLERGYGSRRDDIIDATGNYISQVAIPQIMQQAVLQGLEGGGYVPDSIARATAEYGGNLLSPLMSEYLSSLGDIGQLDIGTGADLSKTFAGLQGSVGTAYMQQLQDAFNRQGALEESFRETLPSAASTFSLIPAQYRNIGANTAATMFPIADYSRGLKETEFGNRLGLAGTAFTGLPYTPQTSTRQRESSQPLFNFFGQG